MKRQIYFRTNLWLLHGIHQFSLTVSYQTWQMNFYDEDEHAFCRLPPQSWFFRRDIFDHLSDNFVRRPQAPFEFMTRNVIRKISRINKIFVMYRRLNILYRMFALLIIFTSAAGIGSQWWSPWNSLFHSNSSFLKFICMHCVHLTLLKLRLSLQKRYKI